MHQKRQERGKPHGSGGRGQPIDFLFEDKDIIVVEKPEGLSVIAAEGSRTKTLYDIVTAHIQRVNPRGRAAVVHRLDRDTSGVMVFAKHAAAKKRLMDNWNELVKERGYTAVVEGKMEGESGLFDSWLVENRAGEMYVTKPGTPGALRALTRWKLIEAGQRYSLVELSLETGRKHQIRVQLADSGHPVAGDPRYGAKSDPLGRLCLHAHLLALEHPFSGQEYSFECPPPEVFLSLPARQREGNHGNSR
ncbi:MAG: RluA family pseudouridine synthase [Rectinemataceae bacterium]|nr:RluA family pseudouridine synthase [Rectinemataceae bacterium]